MSKSGRKSEEQRRRPTSYPPDRSSQGRKQLIDDSQLANLELQVQTRRIATRQTLKIPRQGFRTFEQPSVGIGSGYSAEQSTRSKTALVEQLVEQEAIVYLIEPYVVIEPSIADELVEKNWPTRLAVTRLKQSPCNNYCS